MSSEKSDNVSWLKLRWLVRESRDGLSNEQIEELTVQIMEDINSRIAPFVDSISLNNNVNKTGK